MRVYEGSSLEKVLLLVMCPDLLSGVACREIFENGQPYCRKLCEKLSVENWHTRLLTRNDSGFLPSNLRRRAES